MNKRILEVKASKLQKKRKSRFGLGFRRTILFYEIVAAFDRYCLLLPVFGTLIPNTHARIPISTRRKNSARALANLSDKRENERRTRHEAIDGHEA